MKREQAREILTHNWTRVDNPNYSESELDEAFFMAIKALKDRPTGKWKEEYNGNGWNDFWDYTCSNCGKKYERADAVLYHANYCPNCGAIMIGGDLE